MWATMVFVKGPLAPKATPKPKPTPKPKATPKPTSRAPTDIARSAHRSAISTAWKRGLIDGCDGGRRFCPARNASRAVVATAVARMMDLAPSSRPFFTDVSGTSEINALAEAGIVNGCRPQRFCPDRAVSRAQVAAMLAGALDLPAGGERFTDLPDGYVHSAAINALAGARVTRGCASTRFCPARRVTRAQLASFVVRAQER